MILRWRQPAPAIVTQWRGPDDRVTLYTAANPPQPIAAVIGPPGSGGAGGSPFEFIQSSPSALWTINHNLGFRPASVSVLSAGGLEVDAQVQHISVNQITITFAGPYLGSVQIS